jgi:hypothetical protein
VARVEFSVGLQHVDVPTWRRSLVSDSGMGVSESEMTQQAKQKCALPDNNEVMAQKLVAKTCRNAGGQSVLVRADGSCSEEMRTHSSVH